MSTVNYSFAVLVEDITKRYRYYSDVVNLPVGLIGNCLIILILSTVKIFRGNQGAFYVIIETSANMAFLLTKLPTNIHARLTEKDPMIVSLVWCKLSVTLSNIFGQCSLYTLSFSTFDQYLSTHHRYSMRCRSTMQLAHRSTYSTIAFAIVHSLLSLIFVETRSTTGCRVYNAIITQYYSFFYYPILNTAIPAIVTVSCSLLAYHNVRRIVRRQMTVVRRRLDHQLTAMILARVICLIVLGTPYRIFSFFQLNFSPSLNLFQLCVIR
jgi:hypothetical protein